MKRFATLVALVVAFAPLAAGGQEIDFLEDFALAPDRTVPLGQLIPGTEDHYYYHALHYQNEGEFAKVAELLDGWIKRHGYTPRVQEIRYRQALLTYKQAPQQSLAFIRQELNLQFNHQRIELDQKPNLPTELKQDDISRAAFTGRAMQRYGNLDGFEDTALDWLTAAQLDPDRRRNLLQRLTRPDYANLPELIVADLNHPNGPGFGGYGIHNQLLLAQLDELLKLRPSLLNETNFVNTYVTKLQPNDDVDPRHDRTARRGHLDRMWAFVSRLGPAHNSLKTHVLYHRLEFDRAEGVYDKDRFLTYIQLPRHVSYIEPKFLNQPDNRRFAADLNANFESQTTFQVVGNDEPLVRSFLERFFVEEETYQPYVEFIDSNYLKRVFAITKIVNGIGDQQRWYAMLSPADYQALKDRVDLDFAPTNKMVFASDEPVSLDLHVKNVDKLLVKVYEFNARNYYRDNFSEIDTDVVLEGLVANEEAVHAYAEPPLRRVARRFDFPSLNKPGVYVIDFIGNGKSSRALIQKGRLRHIAEATSAGHRLTVLDEKNRPVAKGIVYLGGQEYVCDDKGRALIPYSTNPGRQPIVLYDGRIATLDYMQHQPESYSFTAGIFVEREQLLDRQKARVVIRPGLYLNGRPVTLVVLEDISLTISTTDLDGVSSVKEVKDLKVSETEELTYEFQVPQRLATINFIVQAKVQSLTRNEKAHLAASQSFALNQIESTDKIDDLFLAAVDGNHLLALLGKSGESLADRAVHLSLKHRDFRDTHNVSLQTDAAGVVRLGPLADITTITASGPSGVTRTWTLREDRHTQNNWLHARAGELIEVAHMGLQPKPDRSELSLLELRGDTFVADRFDALTMDGGLLRVGELPAGDYDLLLKRSGQRMRIRLADGDKLNEWVLGRRRQLETSDNRPLQLDPIQFADDKVTLKLRNVTPATRVHVFATRFVPPYDAFANLSAVRDVDPSMYLRGEILSYYVEGRTIGDEIRYILDRKYATRFPGNMLERPAQLLNPWAIRTTETTEQVAMLGDDFAPAAVPSESAAFGGQGAGGAAGDGGDFSSLNFLGATSAALLNLAPDENGDLTIDRETLGPHQHLHVVAVGPRATAYRSASLPAGELPFNDLRLADGLNPEIHYTQQKRVSVVTQAGPFTLDDITSSRFEMYDSLRRVYSLYTTLSNDPSLAEFNFVLNWPKLTPEEKQAKYSEYACHELHFFLAHKDPKFFADNIQPYLANKKDPTFLDRYLLGQDLSVYLLPWEFERLNMVERVLLGRRIKGQEASMMRHVRERLELLPPNPERRNFLFETALKGSSLDVEDVLGLAGAMEKAEADKKRESKGKLKELELMQRFRNGRGEAQFDRAEEANMPAPTSAAGALTANPPPAPAAEAPANEAKRSDDLAAGKDGAARQNFARGLDQLRKSAEMAKSKSQNGQALAERLQAETELRRSVRQLYRQVDKTKEWVENNYYHLPIEAQNGDLIAVSPFWNDYAQYDGDGPFYSTNLAEAGRNFAEMMLALSVLDLPFESAEHKTEFDKAKMTLQAGGPAVVFHEEIRQVEQQALQTPILVSQNFFRHGDRYIHVNGEQRDKYVTDEFLTHAVYGCQVVVTNPTSTPRKLDVLLQIPNGAIPVSGGKYTRSLHVDLQPFNTQTVEYYFYFPASGDFTHYPVHVAQDEELLAYADAVKLHVVDKPTKIDRESWDYISQYGTDEQVLDYLRQHNLQRLDLEKIAFRMKDKAFFAKTIDYLASQHVYHHTLWSYGVQHDVPQVVRQFLQHADSYANLCGWYIDTPLLTLDPVERRLYQHMEYKPLVNARSHQLGRRRQIVNDRFHQQYHRMLKALSYHPELNDEQTMDVVYYMLLQDRIADAFQYFGKVNPDQLEEKLQYDYFSAYLAFYEADPAKARDIAKPYAAYPVDRWREAFLAVVAQADEIEGANVEVIDDENLAQRQTQLAATEPSFDFKVESQKVTLNYQNLTEVRVNYYLMDIEMLFSRNPFVQQYSGQFSYIRPNQTQLVPLPKNKPSIEFALPADLRNQNVLVEITAAGQTKASAYYSNSLAVQVVENYGHVRIGHAAGKQPLSKVYVKVYARMNDGSIKFYKDGYTDLRGRFDYAALSTNDLDNVDRFALLIVSDEHGAAVREAAPPPR